MAAYKSSGSGSLSAGAVTTTEILDATIATADIADAAVTLAKMANIATDKLIGRDTAGTGVPEALTVSGGLEFSGSTGIQRSALTGDVTATAGSNATTIATDAVVTAKLLDANVTMAKIANATAGLSVVGRSANSTGVHADIAASAASDAVLRESGSVVGFGTIATAGITDAAVTRAKLSNGTALSVIGRSANSGGVPADIVATAASDGVFRESGSVVGFGTIATAGIANSAVTVAKMANLAGLSILGNTGTSSAAPAAITGTASQVLQVNSGGTGLTFASLASTSADISNYRHAVTSSIGTKYYIIGQSNCSTLTTTNVGADQMYSVPFVVAQSVTVASIGIRVTTGVGAGVNNVCRLGIYSATSSKNLYPNTLVVDAGTVSTVNTASVSLAPATVLTAGTLYWAVMWNKGATVTVGAIPMAGMYPMLGSDFGGTADFGMGLFLSTAFGALPGTFAAGATANNAVTPAIYIQFS